MADYVLSVKVTGDATDFNKMADQATSKFESLKKTLTSSGMSTFSKNMKEAGESIKNVGDKLTSKITKPALVAGTALAGITLAKGWSRMTQIDNARAKLEALGNSTKDVKIIMESARQAVDKTAYGMDAAATTAASAVAAGIKPGEQLTRYLTNIADAAAVAGIGMDEMGSIFNKVAANGKISAEEMNQLADRGIPIWRLLAKETGMSMDEVRSAVSSGKIGIEELQNAIQSGMGGAARSIGSSTISGAISNFGAAISRVGASILGTADNTDSLAGKMLPLFNAINSAMGALEEKAKGFGTSLASALGPMFDKITAVFNQIGKGKSTFDAMTAKVAAFGGAFIVALGPMLAITGKLMMVFSEFGPKLSKIASVFGTTSGTLLKFAGIAGAIITIFTLLYTNSETFRNAINQLLVILGGMLKSVFTSLAPVMATVGKLIAVLAEYFGNNLGTAIQIALPIISKLLTIFTKLLSIVTTVMAGVLSAVTTVMSAVVTKITAAKDKISRAIDKIKSIFKNLKLKIGLKIPHVSVSGGKAPWGIGGKGSLPKFRVTWNAAGAVFTKPTIFSTPQGFQGVGEAGPEAVAPISTLQNYISAAVDQGTTSEPIDYSKLGAAIASALSEIDFVTTVDLDSKELARGIAEPVQKSINQLQSRSNRKLGYVQGENK